MWRVWLLLDAMVLSYQGVVSPFEEERRRRMGDTMMLLTERFDRHGGMCRTRKTSPHTITPNPCADSKIEDFKYFVAIPTFQNLFPCIVRRLEHDLLVPNSLREVSLFTILSIPW